MLALLIYRAAIDVVAPWLLRFASRLFARAVNVPEPVVEAAGIHVLARLQAIQAGGIPCPFRMVHPMRGWIRRLL